MSHDQESELPEGWAWSSLGALGTWASGGTPTTGEEAYWDEGTIPWISAKDMKAEFLETAQDFITEKGREAARLTLLPTGSLLMVVRGMILARAFPVAVTAVPATINQDLRALVPSSGMEPSFLLRALQSIAPDILQATGEATHGTRRLESDRLKSWPIPIPPTAEQCRIAGAINAMFERVSSARERLKRALVAVQRFRKALLVAACSGRLTADWRAAHHVHQSPSVPLSIANDLAEGLPELPDCPESWQILTVGGCSTLVQYGTSEKADPDGTIPLLRMGNIQEGRLVFDDLKMVSEDLPGLSGLLLQRGDLLFNRTNSPELVGKAAVFERDDRSTFASYLIRVRCNDDVLDSRLLSWWINSLWGRAWAAKVRTDGVSQSNINGTKLQQMPILVPPKDEQIEIIRRVSSLLSVADSIEQRAASALKKVDALTQAGLAKAFRGELVVTEAELARREHRAYEPANILLDRIRAAANGAVTKASRKTRPTQPTESDKRTSP